MKQNVRWLGLAAAVLLFLFPPFHHPYHDFGGYHFLLSPRAQRGEYGRVDDGMVFMELALVGVGFYLASFPAKR